MKQCHFCQSKVAAKDAVNNIGELMFILSSGSSRETIPFMEIIADIFESNEFAVSLYLEETVL